MSVSSIDRLEERLNYFIEQFKDIKTKYTELLAQNRELQSKLEDREQLIQQLEQKIEQYKQHSVETSQVREREEIIRNKIANLLEKLDKLESML